MLKLLFTAVLALFTFNVGLYLLSTPSNLGVTVGFLCCIAGIVIGIAVSAIIIKNYIKQTEKTDEKN